MGNSPSKVQGPRSSTRIYIVSSDVMDPSRICKMCAQCWSLYLCIETSLNSHIARQRSSGQDLMGF